MLGMIQQNLKPQVIHSSVFPRRYTALGLDPKSPFPSLPQAIQFYEQAVKKQPGKSALWLALADLYMKLGKSGDTVRTLDALQNTLGSSDTVESLMVRSRAQRLSAKLHKAEGAHEEYARVLGEARNTQVRRP